MYNLDKIKNEINIMDLIENRQSLKRISNTGGGEFAGPCPFCGGKDRFHVQPQKNRWFCRQCSEDEGWEDIISFARRIWPNLTFAEICEKLGGNRNNQSAVKPQKNSVPAYSSPSEKWQHIISNAMNEFENNLWKNTGKCALDYLHSRGLQDHIIQQFRLGYSCGKKYDNLWIPQGITVPCIVNKIFWYIKVSLLPGQLITCECKTQAKAREKCPKCGKVSKYKGVSGNRTNSIFNADNLIGQKNAIFCEGEFDCMIATQELKNTIPVVTFGSTTNLPDLATWGPYLLCQKNSLIIYDNDENSAGQKGAKAIKELIKRAVICQLPEGNKDINDFFQKGGNLSKFVLDNITDTELKNIISLEIERKLEKNSKIIVEDTSALFSKINDKAVKHCFACNGTDYWQREDGERICSRCHPKPPGV